MEDFVPIPNFPDYFINKKGDILSRRCPKERILKPSLSNEGYYQLYIYNNNNKRKIMKLHRLLAITFIPNDNNLPFVDHIDRIRTNNTISNLRWASRELNQQNAKRRKDNKIDHKNIYLRTHKINDKEYTSYNVQITRKGKKHRKSLKTLECAIKYRDEYITNLGEEIID
jgi:hypothetical protein